MALFRDKPSPRSAELQGRVITSDCGAEGDARGAGTVWEAIVFSKSDTDDATIQNYLTQLFKAPGTVTRNFQDLETSTRVLGSALRLTTELLNTGSLKLTINGLLKTDLLSDEKVAIPKSFQNSSAVLQEVADVLNMRFSSLETWDWSTINGAILVEQGRQLNGKYTGSLWMRTYASCDRHEMGSSIPILFDSNF